MRGGFRKAIRRVLPRREHALLDAVVSPTPEDVSRAAAYAAVVGGDDDPFVLHRFHEGLRWRHVLESLVRERVRVLDLGAGNGAIELALGSSGKLQAFSVEALWNPVAAEIHEKAGVPLRRAIADAATLPFADASFGAVVFLETIEHVRDPRAVGTEISRVTADNGLVLITTPPRLRYALRPDPHFGIRGLVMLPAALQRRIAALRGFGEAHHYVDRIYTSVPQISRLFPSCAVYAVLSRSRAPKRWFWDAIVLRRNPRDER